jgi:hypothetical protein
MSGDDKNMNLTWAQFAICVCIVTLIADRWLINGNPMPFSMAIGFLVVAIFLIGQGRLPQDDGRNGDQS